MSGKINKKSHDLRQLRKLQVWPEDRAWAGHAAATGGDYGSSKFRAPRGHRGKLTQKGRLLEEGGPRDPPESVSKTSKPTMGARCPRKRRSMDKATDARKSNVGGM